MLCRCGKEATQTIGDTGGPQIGLCDDCAGLTTDELEAKKIKDRIDDKSNEVYHACPVCNRKFGDGQFVRYFKEKYYHDSENCFKFAHAADNGRTYPCPKCHKLGQVTLKKERQVEAETYFSKERYYRWEEPADCDLCKGWGYTQKRMIEKTAVIKDGWKEAD